MQPERDQGQDDHAPCFAISLLERNGVTNVAQADTTKILIFGNYSFE